MAGFIVTLILISIKKVLTISQIGSVNLSKLQRILLFVLALTLWLLLLRLPLQLIGNLARRGSFLIQKRLLTKSVNFLPVLTDFHSAPWYLIIRCGVTPKAKVGEFLSCLNPLIRAVEQNDRVRIFSASEEDIREFPAVRASHHYKDYAIIPCGKCDGCRADYSRKWADRLMIESTLHEDNWFITLTFNDEWLKKECDFKEDWFSLNKRHVQLFMKRLRREVAPMKLRFYACGEYGSRSNRPHYHLIIFGLKFPENDLVFLRKNNLGQDYFSSKLIAKVWSDPDSGESYGFNVVGHVDYDSCRYVARYVMKKLNGPDKLLYEYLGVQAPFVLMSRRPGIAAGYMDEHPEWSEENLIYISTDIGSLAVPPPRYFENELARHDPEYADLRKHFRRDMVENEWSGVRSMTNKSRYGYAKTVESNLKKSLEVLTSFESL